MGDKGSKDKGKKEKQKKAQLNPKEKRKLKKEKKNRHWHSTKDKLQLSTWCNSMKCVCYLPGGIAMAKNQNTFEKQRREMEKKRKAEEKQERRRKKKEQANEPHLLDPPATRDSWPSACRTHMFRYVCLSSRVKRQDTEHSSKSYYRVHMCLCHSRWHVTFFWREPCCLHMKNAYCAPFENILLPLGKCYVSPVKTLSAMRWLWNFWAIRTC